MTDKDPNNHQFGSMLCLKWSFILANYKSFVPKLMHNSKIEFMIANLKKKRIISKDVLIALRDKWSNDPSIYNSHEAPTLLSLMLLKEISE